MKKFAILCFVFTVYSCNTNAQDAKKENYSVSKTESEWKQQLTIEQFNVLRKGETEARFSSQFNQNKAEGTYVCAACQTPLFESKHKYDSGSGWPSFDREIKGNIKYVVDYKIGVPRTEEHCATCGGHLGHVFDDGPKTTTGKRHCINGVALKFIPKTD
ncbi:MAG: peptide-methionine (R)-S-oxide reductase MsrB [Flavobacteriaceae bacterium]|nr:peptide-methionine (R)-S-oxide reductase MsrB [Flavobacteriaceae bacterium]